MSRPKRKGPDLYRRVRRVQRLRQLKRLPSARLGRSLRDLALSSIYCGVPFHQRAVARALSSADPYALYVVKQLLKLPNNRNPLLRRWLSVQS